jgi:hypothetical protein
MQMIQGRMQESGGMGAAIPGMGSAMPRRSLPGMGGAMPGMGAAIPGMGGRMSGIPGAMPGHGGSPQFMQMLQQRMQSAQRMPVAGTNRITTPQFSMPTNKGNGPQPKMLGLLDGASGAGSNAPSVQSTQTFHAKPINRPSNSTARFDDLQRKAESFNP